MWARVVPFLWGWRWPIALGLASALLSSLGAAAWGWLFGSLAFAALLITSPGLRLAIWHSRVPSLFALIGVLAFTVPEQVRHLIAGTEGIWQALALAAAVLATGMGCWFWARWSLNLAWAGGLLGRDLPELAWGAWPRVLALAPAVAALIAVLQGWALLPFWTLVALVPLILAAGAGLVALAWGRRLHIEARRAAPGLMTRRSDMTARLFQHDEGLRPLDPPPRGWGEWLRLALACLPFHPAPVALLAAGFLLVSILVMSGIGPVIPVTQAVGAAPTALFGLASILTLLGPVIGFLAAARRWPALLLLLAWMVGAAAANVNTAVRTPMPYPEGRLPLDQAARRWLERCAERREDGQVRVMLVAAAGGASRAALWAAAVMHALEREEAGPRLDPARHVFALSGVSGGALGLSAYVATLDAAGAGCGDAGPAGDAEARHRLLREGLGRDFLAPALAGLFFGDAWWRVLGPFTAVARLFGVVAVERTVWLQNGWEAAFGGQAGPLARPLAARTMAGPEGAPRLPLLFTSGTHLETGRLVVTAPVAPPAPDAPCDERTARSAVPGAMDALCVLRSDLPFSVAASNSARFPYVTAPGLLRSRTSGAEYGQVVDGGYYDNLGTTALLAAARALERAHADLARQGSGPLAGSRLHLFVVQVWSDPDRTLEEVPRCPALPVPRLEAASPSPLDFLLSPFGALASVRGERANAGATPLAEIYCAPQPGGAETARHRFHAFTMGPDAEGVKAPLNWVLPSGIRDTIAASGLGGFVGRRNGEELRALGREWCLAANPPSRCPP